MSSFLDRSIKGLLDDISELSLALASSSRPPKLPALFLASALASTTIASNFVVPALLLLPAVAIALKFSNVRKVVAYTAAFSAVVVAPLFLTSNFWTAGTFLLRVVSSSASFSLLVALVGWDGFVSALADIGFPKEIVLSLRLLPYQLHFMLKDALSAALARRSRTFSNDLRTAWRVLATVVGSLLLRGVRRGQTLSLALKARGLGEPSSRKYAMPTLVSLIMLGVSLLGLVVEWRVVPLR